MSYGCRAHGLPTARYCQFGQLEYLCVQSLDGRGGTDSCRTDCADFRLVGIRAKLNFKSPRLSRSVSANETTFGNQEWIVSKFDSVRFSKILWTHSTSS